MFLPHDAVAIKSLPGNRRILYGGVTFVVVAAVVAAVVILIHLRAETLRRAVATTQYLANSVEQTLEGMIDGIDFALQVSADEVARQVAGGHPEPAFINGFLAQQQARLPYLDLLRVTNDKGEAVYGQGVVPDARASLAQRDYFKRLRGDPRLGMVIAEPVVGAISQKWIWLMARRIDRPDGAFGGLVYASLFIDEIVRIFDQIRMSPDSVIALLDKEMRLVARSTFNHSAPLPIGRNATSSAFVGAFRRNPLEGTFDTSDGGLDGVRRLYYYRRNPKYGFLVHVGSPMHEITAEWQQQAMMVTGMLAVFMLTALTFARSLGRRWQQQEADIATLETAVAERTSELNEQRRVLKELYNRHELAATAGNIGIWDWYVPADRLVWDERMAHLYGLGPGEFTGDYAAWRKTLHPDDLAGCEQALRLALAGEQEFYTEFRVIWPDASIHHLFGTATVKRDENGAPLRMTGINYDITEQKKAHARIEFLAFRDPLTGLPNRQLGQDRLQQGLTAAGRRRTMLAVLYLDLDNFKYVNDTHGYTVGDLLLKGVALRLQAHLRVEDTLCRLSGDEFLVVLPDLRAEHPVAQVVAVCEDVLNGLDAPFELDGRQVFSSAAVGVVLYPQDADTAEGLLRNAHIALHEAKKAGHRSYRFFEAQMNAELRRFVETREALRAAVERREFVLHYQPQVDLRSGRVVGVEALLRWRRSAAGLTMPNTFIDVAEESGLIAPIGRWVLGEACRQAAIWHAAGWPELVMAVNLSAVQFRQGQVVQDVAAALADSGLNPARLELELTESILLESQDSILKTLADWKAGGIQLSIDDFGTGYSSLAYLKRFKVDKLKIDRSFVANLLCDDDDRTIVLAMIQLARSLNLRTIAEGVEDTAVAEQLKLMGCDEVQGYLYAKPLAAAELESWLTDWDRRCAGRR